MIQRYHKVGFILANLSNGIYQAVKWISHAGNIWLGPWVNFPHYMDGAFI